MIKKGVIILSTVFVLILISSFASAALNTTLILHGPPFHYQIVRVLDPTTRGVITSIYPGESYTGITESSFLTTNTQVTFLVIDRYNRIDKAKYDSFDNYPVGGKIELWLPGAFNETGYEAGSENENVTNGEVIGNESELNETIALNESKEKIGQDVNGTTGLSLTGLVSYVGETFNNPYVKYGLFGLFGFVVLLFVVIKGMAMLTKRKPSGLPEVNAGSPLGKLQDAEVKLRDLERDIEELKKAEAVRAQRRKKMLEKRRK